MMKARTALCIVGGGEEGFRYRWPLSHRNLAQVE